MKKQYLNNMKTNREFKIVKIKGKFYVVKNTN